jgi:transcriptional regulator with XRE-family HTH domain
MFAQRLRELRKKKKLTMKEFGKKFSLAESTISGYENGTRTPDLSVIDQFADFFEVSTDYLLGRTDNPQPIIKERSGTHSTEVEKFAEEKLQRLISVIANMSKEEQEEFMSFLDFNLEVYLKRKEEERKDRA